MPANAHPFSLISSPFPSPPLPRSSLLTQEGICLTLDPAFHFLEVRRRCVLCRVVLGAMHAIGNCTCLCLCASNAPAVFPAPSPATADVLPPCFPCPQVAYPYVARRLLTDEDPALRTRLFQVGSCSVVHPTMHNVLSAGAHLLNSKPCLGYPNPGAAAVRHPHSHFLPCLSALPHCRCCSRTAASSGTAWKTCCSWPRRAAAPGPAAPAASTCRRQSQMARG